jgi:hypothetical protein
MYYVVALCLLHHSSWKAEAVSHTSIAPHTYLAQPIAFRTAGEMKRRRKEESEHLLNA